MKKILLILALGVGVLNSDIKELALSNLKKPASEAAWEDLRGALESESVMPEACYIVTKFGRYANNLLNSLFEEFEQFQPNLVGDKNEFFDFFCAMCNYDNDPIVGKKLGKFWA